MAFRLAGYLLPALLPVRNGLLPRLPDVAKAMVPLGRLVLSSQRLLFVANFNGIFQVSVVSRSAVRLAYHLLKWAGDEPSKASASRFRKILDHARRQRRRDLLTTIVGNSNGTVVEGPFTGITFSTATCQHDVYIGAKLLGFYEREIQDLLLSWQGKSFDAIVNVGSASGFFALGSSKLLQPRQIWAVDIEEAELKICQENFALNKLDGVVHYRSAMNAQELADIASEHPKTLIISDCEGFEAEIFTSETAASLKTAHLIIECHDFVDPAITRTLKDLFSESHDLTIIEEGSRDPNGSEHLRSLSSNDRWLVISEDRPETMHWLIATPKT